MAASRRRFLGILLAITLIANQFPLVATAADTDVGAGDPAITLNAAEDTGGSPAEGEIGQNATAPDGGGENANTPGAEGGEAPVMPSENESADTD